MGNGGSPDFRFPHGNFLCSELSCIHAWIRERLAAEERSWMKQALFYQLPETVRFIGG